MKLSECPTRSNNLQLFRFVASILVIVSHSFVISTGDASGEWLSWITNQQLSMGGLAVAVFFCAGGYLIARSMDRIKDGREYFKIRALRIFPALAIVILLSAFVLGPCMTEYRVQEYFSDIGVYRYLLNGVLILQHELPGVFQHNPYLATVNGSLWTLPVEFLCYVGCYVMWKIGFFAKKRAKYSVPIVAVGLAGVVALVKHLELSLELTSLVRPMILFYVGILFYIYREHILLTKRGALLCAAGLILFNLFKLTNVGMVLCFPYLLMYLCFAVSQIPEKIGKSGNISYGVYLCAFPIQQLLVVLFGGRMHPAYNTFLAVPLSILGGYLLYLFVEEPVTKLISRKK
ncbi:acyltransferase family protein [Suipraeoptans intestinalis]|uniref:acyltransferase family protein n=1 Tax=Suipraeoptans intestinalis TaxID=2606628 RepID=UPI0023F55FAB|nr:acyltransferase [Suipraeoptans intestinalis]MDD7770233.1 acyltransferase [Suipraeoptans intestinalis]MDY3122732.1 acyltransferase [Suipraeoptans intestinalis]